MIICLIVCVQYDLTVDPFVPFDISLYLLKRRKERGGKKAAGEALESLEAQLRDRAETLGLSLEQKTKGMKQRDKKVNTGVLFSIFQDCKF